MPQTAQYLEDIWRHLTDSGCLRQAQPGNRQRDKFTSLRSQEFNWKCQPVIPAFGRWRQEDQEFKVSLATWDTVNKECVWQERKPAAWIVYWADSAQNYLPAKSLILLSLDSRSHFWRSPVWFGSTASPRLGAPLLGALLECCITRIILLWYYVPVWKLCACLLFSEDH